MAKMPSGFVLASLRGSKGLTPAKPVPVSFSMQ